MSTREGPALLGSTLVRADGRGATRIRHARGFVLLMLQVKRFVLRGGKTGEWARTKNAWRVTPPRHWEFATVAIADWSLELRGRANVPLEQVGLSAALDHSDDGKLQVWVQGVCRSTSAPASWRGAVNVQVSIFGPVPGPATSSLAIPSAETRRPQSRVPRAARGLR